MMYEWVPKKHPMVDARNHLEDARMKVAKVTEEESITFPDLDLVKPLQDWYETVIWRQKKGRASINLFSLKEATQQAIKQMKLATSQGFDPFNIPERVMMAGTWRPNPTENTWYYGFLASYTAAIPKRSRDAIDLAENVFGSELVVLDLDSLNFHVAQPLRKDPIVLGFVSIISSVAGKFVCTNSSPRTLGGTAIWSQAFLVTQWGLPVTVPAKSNEVK